MDVSVPGSAQSQREAAGQVLVLPSPLTNLTAVPNPASPNQLVSASLFDDGCVAFGPGGEVVTVQGFSVTLVNTVDTLCGVPTPSFYLEFPLGRFSPGTYTLTYAPKSYFSGVTYQVLTTQFVVQAPATVPLFSGGASIFVIFGLAVAAYRHLTIRSSGRLRVGCGRLSGTAAAAA